MRLYTYLAVTSLALFLIAPPVYAQGGAGGGGGSGGGGGGSAGGGGAAAGGSAAGAVGAGGSAAASSAGAGVGAGGTAAPGTAGSSGTAGPIAAGAGGTAGPAATGTSGARVGAAVGGTAGGALDNASGTGSALPAAGRSLPGTGRAAPLPGQSPTGQMRGTVPSATSAARPATDLAQPATSTAVPASDAALPPGGVGPATTGVLNDTGVNTPAQPGLGTATDRTGIGAIVRPQADLGGGLQPAGTGTDVDAAFGSGAAMDAQGRLAPGLGTTTTDPLGAAGLGGTTLAGAPWGLSFADGVGLVVNDVPAQSIWVQSGLRPGDAIIAINGQPVNSADVFRQQLVGSDFRGRVPVMIQRDGRYENIYLPQREVVGYRPDTSSDAVDLQKRAWLGVFLDNRYPNYAVVDAVQVGSGADRAGIRAGDWIMAVNGQPVRSPTHLSQLISSLEPGVQVDLEVAQRQRSSMAVELGSRPETFAREDQVGGGSEGSGRQLRDGSTTR